MLRHEWAVIGTWKAATLKKMQMMEAQLVQCQRDARTIRVTYEIFWIKNLWK